MRPQWRERYRCDPSRERGKGRGLQGIVRSSCLTGASRSEWERKNGPLSTMCATSGRVEAAGDTSNDGIVRRTRVG